MAEVGCAGILVSDLFCGPMNELPRAGELVCVGNMPSRAGGCAANVAINLAKQGVAVDAYGCVGRDPAAATIVGQLQKSGVDCRGVTAVDSHPTSQTVILLVEGQDRRYVHAIGANAAFTVSTMDRDRLAALKVFYLGGLFAMPGLDIDELADLLQFCRSRNVLTVIDVVVPAGFDAGGALATLLPFIDYFLPNDEEAERLTGLSDPVAQATALRRAGAGTVVITAGAEGATAAEASGVWSCPAHRINVVDPSGSGDAFAAGLVAGLVKRWDLPRALQYAAALGASAARAIGTTDGVFTASEAAAFMSGNPLAVAPATRPALTATTSAERL